MRLNPVGDKHTIALGKVTTLNHEVLDNTVEGRILVTKALLAGSQSAKRGVSLNRNIESVGAISNPYRKFSAVYIKNDVSDESSIASFTGYSLTNLGDSLAVQAEDNAAKRLLSMLDVEVDLNHQSDCFNIEPVKRPRVK
jgi:hypothetical protein